MWETSKKVIENSESCFHLQPRIENRPWWSGSIYSFQGSISIRKKIYIYIFFTFLMKFIWLGLDTSLTWGKIRVLILNQVTQTDRGVSLTKEGHEEVAEVAQELQKYCVDEPVKSPLIFGGNFQLHVFIYFWIVEGSVCEFDIALRLLVKILFQACFTS